MDTARHERSLGELFSDLSQQTAELIRQEVLLAKAELTGKAGEVGRHAAKVGAAAVFGLAAVLALTAGVVLLMIEAGLPPWLSAVLTAALTGLVAFALWHAGASALKSQSLAPVETVKSLKETTQWIKSATK